MSNISSNPTHRAGFVALGVRNVSRSYLQEGLINLFDLVQNWTERRRARGQLYQMPDYMLQDIGVSRAEVDSEFNKPFWRP
jgi:uncharacterized protein YjiS (DUF1127 family)